MKRKCVLALILALGPIGFVGCAGTQTKTAEDKGTSAPAAAVTAPAAPVAPAPAAEQAAPAPMAAPTTTPAAEKTDGARTIEALFRDRATLGGQTVLVRGKVVKAKSGIMGKTWIHIQDGTGGPGTNDLTVTTMSGEPAIGKKVLVKGVAAVNKDFGAGYRYDLIVEDATVTVE